MLMTNVRNLFCFLIEYYCLHLPLQVSKEFFPRVAVGYEDPRVTLHVGDGI